MHSFRPNDITQFGRNLRNMIAMSCISGTYRKNFRNSYDITKGKLLRYSNSFLFAYMLFPVNCITEDGYLMIIFSWLLNKK